MLENSDAIDEAKSMQSEFGGKALEALKFFPESDAQLALKNIVKAATTS